MHFLTLLLEKVIGDFLKATKGPFQGLKRDLQGRQNRPYKSGLIESRKSNYGSLTLNEASARKSNKIV